MTSLDAILPDLDRQRTYYQQAAAAYDDAHPGGRESRLHRNKLFNLARLMQLKPGMRVLEVGVGTGIHAQWLKDGFDVDVVGVDLSQAMLDIAQQRLGPSAELHACPAESLPFDDSVFDAVYCCATLHHLADKPRGVLEMARVVKPGGRVAMSEPNILHPLNIRQWLLIPEEKGQLDVRPRTVQRWIADAGLTHQYTGFQNYTPPIGGPATGRILDKIDRCLASTPLIRRLSTVVQFAAIKP